MHLIIVSRFEWIALRPGCLSKLKCRGLPVKTCLMCGTAPMSEASEMDTKLLKVAQDKHSNKQPHIQTDALPSSCPAPPMLPQCRTTLTEPVQILCTGPETALVGGTAGPSQKAENTSFSAAVLSTFKASKRRRMALSARSGLKDNRPLPEDKNVFKNLLARRRGFSPAARVITRILKMYRDAGSHSTAGPQGAGLYQKALWLL